MTCAVAMTREPNISAQRVVAEAAATLLAAAEFAPDLVTMASTNLAFTHAQRACQALQKMVPRLVNAAVVIHNEPILHCEPASVPPLMEFLKMHSGTRCKQLVDITAVDKVTALQKGMHAA